MSVALHLENLDVSYGAIQALRGVDVTVNQGEIVTLIGANGAGKSTLLRAASGMVRAKSGRVQFLGEDITRQSIAAIVSRGLIHCPEGRRIFANMTVKENLELGAYLRNDKQGIADDYERALNYFPRLRERLAQSAGTLSGGEQQMLAIGRSLMSRPKLLMLDEPSLGLAPLLVQEIFKIIVTINAESGTSILLVEQNANQALAVAHRAYVLETGTITLSGDAAELKSNPDVQKAYLGHG
ncbi:MAG: high-affinity branched-chain amino acid transport ATP-binding protein BraG [Armatimonadota bacterium]|jgi:branched-chain amino acid transport system ATP-binding protein